MIIKFRLPYTGINQELLKEDVASEFSSLAVDDLEIITYGRYEIGVRAASVDAANFTQSDIDTAVTAVQSTAGSGVDAVDWGEPPL